jgi:putative flippase GtrA
MSLQTTLREAATVLVTSPSLSIGRYFFAGVAVSLGYTATIVFMMEWLGWGSASLANAVSFLLWTPVSYIAHRDFTFRHDGAYAASAGRFAVTILAKFLTSVAVVALITEHYGQHYMFSVLANWVAIPLANYFALKLWVFRSAAR